MEGVVVSARREGANFTVSVVSDAQGKYSFPRTHLEPGKYALTIRAVGYDLSGPGYVEITDERTTTADLKLDKTRDLASQMSSLEWAMSAPGTPEQKDHLIYQIGNCAYCHSWERIMKSNHTAEEFVDLITRMQSYYPDGSAVSRDKRGRGQIGILNQVALAAQKIPDGDSTLCGPRKIIHEYLATIALVAARIMIPRVLKTTAGLKEARYAPCHFQYDMPARPDTGCA